MKSVIATTFAALAAVVLALTACTASEQTAVANLSDAVAPLVASFVPGAPPVLTAVAQLACAAQSAANAQGNSALSTLVGAACKW